MKLVLRWSLAAAAVSGLLASGCGGSGSGGATGSAGRGGSAAGAGAGGATGLAGTGGVSGASGAGGGGTSGGAGVGGSGVGGGGMSGSAGAGGVGGGGMSGSAGTGGAGVGGGGMSGSAGVGGVGGVGGGGASGSVGTGGVGGGGTSGSAGAGVGGTSGSAGSGGTAGAAGTGGSIALSCTWRGDFDGDGVADCARAQAGAGTQLDLVFNKGVAANLYLPTSVITPDLVPPNYHSFMNGMGVVAIGSVIDLNHDMRQDIVVSYTEPGSGPPGMWYSRVRLFPGRPDGTFDPDVPRTQPIVGRLDYFDPGPTIADFDGDGFADMLVNASDAGLYASYSWIVLMSSGGLDLHIGGGTSAQSLRGGPFVKGVADLNGDGRLDIAALAQQNMTAMGLGYANYVFVSFGAGNGNFSAPTKIAGADGATNVAIADANNDGKLDLMVTLADTPTPFYGNGAGQFSTTAP